MQGKMFSDASLKKRRTNPLSKVNVHVWETENNRFSYEEPALHHLFSCTKIMKTIDTHDVLSFNMKEWMDEKECPNTSLDRYQVESMQYLYDAKGISVVSIRIYVTQEPSAAC